MSNIYPLKTFTVQISPYYNQYNQCYKNILIVNGYPQGPLNMLVRRINFPYLTTNQKYFNNSPCNNVKKCGLGIINIDLNEYTNINFNLGCCNKYNSGCDLMTPDEIPNLVSFLLNNGYQIETQLTNLLNLSPVKSSNIYKNGFTATYYGKNEPNITYMR
jgi:hypothetical protein